MSGHELGADHEGRGSFTLHPDSAFGEPFACDSGPGPSLPPSVMQVPVLAP